MPQGDHRFVVVAESRLDAGECFFEGRPIERIFGSRQQGNRAARLLKCSGFLPESGLRPRQGSGDLRIVGLLAQCLQ